SRRSPRGAVGGLQTAGSRPEAGADAWPHSSCRRLRRASARGSLLDRGTVNLLLDTHILIWWAQGDRKLSKSLRNQIASSENEVAVSAATFWELAIKSRLGRIDLDLDELRAAVRADGFDELPVQVEHTLRLRDLPDHHQD